MVYDSDLSRAKGLREPYATGRYLKTGPDNLLPFNYINPETGEYRIVLTGTLDTDPTFWYNIY